MHRRCLIRFVQMHRRRPCCSLLPSLPNYLASRSTGQAPPMNHETHPGDTGVARDHHPVQTCRGRAVARTPHSRVRGPYQSGQRGACGTTPAHRSANGLRFFSLAQAHVAGSVRYVSAATNTPSRNAKTPGYGMGQQAEHKKTSKAGWSRQTEPPYASTGSFRRAVDLPATWRSTGAVTISDLAIFNFLLRYDVASEVSPTWLTPVYLLFVQVAVT